MDGVRGAGPDRTGCRFSAAQGVRIGEGWHRRRAPIPAAKTSVSATGGVPVGFAPAPRRAITPCAFGGAWTFGSKRPRAVADDAGRSRHAFVTISVSP